ncbi:hypothetical protein PIB30_039891 [Stylosanthes scabra]|uniref:Uncharacterized protein n=1 Tax=Stylosanthes scabra TaxID=79078 RepID=A0ABU6YD96_9FABA|nr:hypothetical protein [Stylosanthes scabra]
MSKITKSAGKKNFPTFTGSDFLSEFRIVKNLKLLVKKNNGVSFKLLKLKMMMNSGGNSCKRSGEQAQDSLGSWPGSEEKPEIRYRANPELGKLSATIPSSNTSLHEPASRFRLALRLPGRSWAESAAFGASRLNPGSAPVHSVESINGPTLMVQLVHLVDRSTGLDQSMPVNHRSMTVKAGQSWSTISFFLAPARHKKSNGYNGFCEFGP